MRFKFDAQDLGDGDYCNVLDVEMWIGWHNPDRTPDHGIEFIYDNTAGCKRSLSDLSDLDRTAIIEMAKEIAEHNAISREDV